MRASASFWFPILAAGLAAQTPAPSPAGSPETLFRSTTRVVQVNVIVKSKAKPLEDLMPPDFTLFDQGKPQRIAFFSLQRSRTAAKGQPLPPGVYSNQVNADGEAPTAVTVVLLDGLNTRWSDQAWAKTQIVRFLQTLQPRDRVAVFTLGHTVRVLFDFTSDFARLQQSLARYRGENLAVVDTANPAPADTGIREIDEFLDDSNRVFSALANEDRVRTTAASFEGIARYLSRIPGRKNLVWVSGSFPLQIGIDDPEVMRKSRVGIRSFHQELERAARALNDANIAVYPVDARGLIGKDLNTAGMGIPDFVSLKPAQPEIDTMNKLAADTGGKAFYNTNGVAEAIREAVNDAEVTYNLGFYPAELDGKFHELKVEVARKGVQVRHRRGYHAAVDAGATRSRVAVIGDAMTHPLDATGIGIIAGVVRAGEDWRVRFYAEVNKIGLYQQDGRWRAELDCLVAQQTGNGRTLKAESRVFSLNLTEENLRQLRRQIEEEGLLFEHQFKPEKETTQVRLVLYDRRSGQVGSLRLPAPRDAAP